MRQLTGTPPVGHGAASTAPVDIVSASAIFAGVGLFAAFLLLLWLAKRSDILRDSQPTILPPGQRRPYSLGRCQMAFWLFVTAGTFIFIFVTTGRYNNVITDQSLVLLGISSATGLSSVTIDSNRNAGIVWPTHTTLLNDLLTDVNGVTIHRFQMLMWTVILGILYVISASRTHGLPDFDPKLLMLMGISSGLYVGLKVPERQQ